VWCSIPVHFRRGVCVPSTWRLIDFGISLAEGSISRIWCLDGEPHHRRFQPRRFQPRRFQPRRFQPVCSRGTWVQGSAFLGVAHSRSGGLERWKRGENEGARDLLNSYRTKTWLSVFLPLSYLEVMWCAKHESSGASGRHKDAQTRPHSSLASGDGAWLLSRARGMVQQGHTLPAGSCGVTSPGTEWLVQAPFSWAIYVQVLCQCCGSNIDWRCWKRNSCNWLKCL